MRPYYYRRPGYVYSPYRGYYHAPLYVHRPVVVAAVPYHYAWYHPYYTVGGGAFPMYGIYIICSFVLLICILIVVFASIGSCRCCGREDPPPPEPIYDPYSPYVVDPYYQEPYYYYDEYAYPADYAYAPPAPPLSRPPRPPTDPKPAVCSRTQSRQSSTASAPPETPKGPKQQKSGSKEVNNDKQ